MEVKDVTKVTALDAVTVQAADKTTEKSPSGTSQVQKSEPSLEDEIEVNLSHENAEATEVNDSRLKANALISRVNVAVEGTDKIGKILKSISGIVDQADDAPAPLKEKFDREAKGLVKEITNIALSSTKNNFAPIVKDKYRDEVEDTIGKTLDVIFPGSAKTAYGLDAIELSTKETIISTRSTIAKAVAEYEELRQKVAKSVEDVKAFSASVDDVAKTKESLQPSVRVVDDAIKLTGGARTSIRQGPAEAIASIGIASAQVLQ